MGREPGMAAGVQTGLMIFIDSRLRIYRGLNDYLPCPIRMAGMVFKIRTISSHKDQ